MRKISYGFSLIELLVVMGILGIIATIVLVAVNPLENLSKANDGKTKQSVAQLGVSLTSYYTTKNAYPSVSTLWMDDLISGGDLSDRHPKAPEVCSPASALDSNFCLQVSGNAAVVYAKLTSKSEASKCDISGEVPYFLFDTAKSRACIVCGAPTEAFSPGVTCDADN